jgi:ParB family chromosome partitioning protein
LEALIPKRAPGVDEVDIDLIVPNPHQPRSAVDEASLEELAASIREHGVLQPLLVSAGEPEGVYQLIAGERRLRAARMAGLTKVPVVVRESAPRELLELALVENLQREDLNPIEQAQAYRRLADEFGMTQDEIAQRVGRSRAAVANALRLLTLEPELRESLAQGEITEGHARALLGAPEAVRLEAWREVVRRGLTVRETEALVRRLRRSPSKQASVQTKEAPSMAPELRAAEEALRRALGTKVELRVGSGGSGQVVIHYYSQEELNALLTRLGARVE